MLVKISQKLRLKESVCINKVPLKTRQLKERVHNVKISIITRCLLAVHEAFQISQESALRMPSSSTCIGLALIGLHNGNLFMGGWNSATAGFVFSVFIIVTL